MLKVKTAGMLLGCLVSSWLVTGPVSQNPVMAQDRGRSPWSSEIGEAKDVVHTAKQISDRLRDKYAFCPATAPAMRLEQSAGQLKQLVEDGAHLRSIHSSMNSTRTLGVQVQKLIAEDRHVRSDTRLLAQLGELNKRIDRLGTELNKSADRVSATAGYGSIHRPTRNEHVARYPQFIPEHRGSRHDVPDWHNPFPTNRNHSDRAYRAPSTYNPPNYLPPTVVVPTHPIHIPHTRNSHPPARRILSTILSEVFDTL